MACNTGLKSAPVGDEPEPVNTKLRDASKSTTRVVWPGATCTGPPKLTLMPDCMPLGTLSVRVFEPSLNVALPASVMRAESTTNRSCS